MSSQYRPSTAGLANTSFANTAKTALATLTALAVGLLSTATAIAAPETPVTEPASEITGTSATLNGVLNPGSSDTTGYHFIYGSEGSCEGSSTEAGEEATGEALAVSTPITGLIPHSTYTFCVMATNAAAEESQGSPVSFETLPVPPAIEEQSASAIAHTTATLSALINPQSQETNCLGFQYVDQATFTTDEFASAQQVPCEPEFLGSGAFGEPTSVSLTGLQANTTYHFRALAENPSGQEAGPDSTFLTLPDLPTVGTGQASAITANAATIEGSVNPGSSGPNSDTTYAFQYGRTSAYGTQTPSTPGDVGQGTSPVTQNANLTGLQPGAVYHYRIIATNNNTGTPQTAFGEDATFTTTATPPIFSAFSVSAITQTSATFNATLDPQGLATRYELKLGATTGRLQTQAFGNSDTTTPLALTATSLSPNTLYYYSLSATNLNGAQPPIEGSFTTAPAPGAPTPLAQPPTPPLLAIPGIAFPSQSAIANPHLTILTRAQRLAKALKVCKHKPKGKRAGCRRAAKRRFG